MVQQARPASAQQPAFTPSIYYKTLVISQHFIGILNQGPAYNLGFLLVQKSPFKLLRQHTINIIRPPPNCYCVAGGMAGQRDIQTGRQTDRQQGIYRQTGRLYAIHRQ